MATFVVDGGLGQVVAAILALTTTEPLNIGWGTGTQTTTTRTDTGLGPTTVERDVDLAGTTGSRTVGTGVAATTNSTDDTYRVTGTRTATGAGTVTCAGLFTSATIASGSMFLKGDFAGVALAIGDSISFTISAVFDN